MRWLIIVIVFIAGAGLHLAGSPGGAGGGGGDAVYFARDVMPLLDRAGCSAVQCHGAFAGQGGMALSLFGGSPVDDYETLVKAERVRRVNRFDPPKSLVLMKPTAKMKHGGGQKIAPDSAEYRTILAWIEQGARYDDPALPTLKSVTLGPAEISLKKDAQQSLTLKAVYSDNSQKDVTRLAMFQSSDPDVATVDASGKLTVKGFGMCTVVGQYSRNFGVQQVIVPQPIEGEFPAFQPANKIDELVLANLRKLGLPPAELCGDEVFLRRVFIDVIGTLPTSAEARAFLSSKNPAKRKELIDGLLNREEFATFWALKWSDLLRIKAENPVSLWPKGAEAYYQWVYESLAQNKPYDQFARELLTATGSNFRSGPSNFYRAVPSRDARTYGESAALTFMGTRLSCARCHGHPEEGWGQEDYLGMAAMFAEVKLKLTDEWKEQVVYRDPAQVLRHPRTGQLVVSRPLGGAQIEVKPGADPRAEFAQWLTAPENPWFARNITNRIWYWVMGRGIVHEPDDLRPTNPPENPALLEYLAGELVTSKYDLKHIYRLILNSRTYQASSVPHPGGRGITGHFAYREARRLTAEQLIDAVSQVTETKPGQFGGFGRPTLAPITSMPEDLKAVAISDGSAECTVASTLGRPQRATGFENERGTQMDRDIVEFLANSAEVAAAIDNSPLLKRLEQSKKSDADVVEEMYLTVLCRLPNNAEKQKMVEYLVAKKASRPEAMKDLMWALINANTFVLNQ